MAYEVKTYVVQKADVDGVLGEVLAVKLTYEAAHRIAKQHAPAKVHFAVADKTPERNVGQTTRN
jgi:surfactin synthase thioesterase subunit